MVALIKSKLVIQESLKWIENPKTSASSVSLAVVFGTQWHNQALLRLSHEQGFLSTSALIPSVKIQS